MSDVNIQFTCEKGFANLVGGLVGDVPQYELTLIARGESRCKIEELFAENEDLEVELRWYNASLITNRHDDVWIWEVTIFSHQEMSDLPYWLANDISERINGSYVDMIPKMDWKQFITVTFTPEEAHTPVAVLTGETRDYTFILSFSHKIKHLGDALSSIESLDRHGLLSAKQISAGPDWTVYKIKISYNGNARYRDMINILATSLNARSHRVQG